MKAVKTNRRNNRRSKSGVSLTELMVSSILLGVSLAVVAELMSLAVLADTKLNKQFDAQTALRIALSRIKQDVRIAKKVVYSTPEFPGEVSNAQTLILHLPVYFLDKKNDPRSTEYVQSAPQNPLNGIPLWGRNFNVPSEKQISGYDAVMYKIVRNTEQANSNDFKIEVSQRYQINAVLDSSSSHRQEIYPPETLAKGIIGPLAVDAGPDSVPKVFTFLSYRQDPANADIPKVSLIQESLLAAQIDGTAGIGIDLEIRKTLSSASEVQLASESVRASHTEVFLKLPVIKRADSNAVYYELD